MGDELLGVARLQLQEKAIDLEDRMVWGRGRSGGNSWQALGRRCTERGPEGPTVADPALGPPEPLPDPSTHARAHTDTHSVDSPTWAFRGRGPDGFAVKWTNVKTTD